MSKRGGVIGKTAGIFLQGQDYNDQISRLHLCVCVLGGELCVLVYMCVCTNVQLIIVMKGAVTVDHLLSRVHNSPN